MTPAGAVGLARGHQTLPWTGPRRGSQKAQPRWPPHSWMSAFYNFFFAHSHLSYVTKETTFALSTIVLLVQLSTSTKLRAYCWEPRDQLNSKFELHLAMSVACLSQIHAANSTYTSKHSNRLLLFFLVACGWRRRRRTNKKAVTKKKHST